MSQPAERYIAHATLVANDVLAKHAADVDRQARWPSESLAAVAQAGLLGLTVPATLGGAAQGPRTFATVLSTLAEQCASSGMIYFMHICGTQVIAGASNFGQRDDVLKAIAAGKHLSTLAFSEKGSRSHFWAPVSQAKAAGDGCKLSADKS